MRSSVTAHTQWAKSPIDSLKECVFVNSAFKIFLISKVEIADATQGQSWHLINAIIGRKNQPTKQADEENCMITFKGFLKRNKMSLILTVK